MPIQFTDVDGTIIPGLLLDDYTRTVLTSLTITEQTDTELTLRAKRIFRSRRYNPKRSVESRFNSKPGRPKKLQQVSVNE